MDMTKYREMFLSETREHLNSMSRQVVTLEKDPSDREGIDALFRNAHSIKGMAASMGYESCTRLAHCLEDLMDKFRQTGTVPAEAVDNLLIGIDLLEGLLEDIEAEKPEREVDSYLKTVEQPCESTETESPAAPEENILQVSVDLSPQATAPAARAILIIRQLEQIGEVLDQSPDQQELEAGHKVHHLEARLKTGMDPEGLESALSAMPDVTHVEAIRQTQTKGASLQDTPPPTPRRDESGRTIRVRTALLDQFINITGELLNNRYMLQSAVNDEQWSSVKQGLEDLARLVTDMHNHVLQVRMLPLESISGRLPRQVREFARKAGKQIELNLEGEDIELDRTILEMLADPLMHMVRNAVDHGIENEGTISVRAWREKDLVLLEVADDGRGMDPGKICRKALEKNLVTNQQIKTLRDRDILQLVCMPGFSTASSVTETSGRGVGMDVVKNTVESLGGMLQIDSALGEGTRVLLKLPLSVAIIRILLVGIDEKVVGIPITRVFRTIEVDRQQIKSSGKQLVIRFEEELIPLLSLRKILRLPSRSHTGTLPVVVSEFRGRKVGLVVDRLVGQRESFVKSLAPPLDGLAGISGATFLGDGNIVFIIDPQSLIEENLFSSRRAAEGVRT
ncbi:MAG: chemotaxis protein CheA [Desulfuromonadales bacterium]